MDLSKYAALFLAESREHLNACNASLLQWERAPAAVEPVDRVFRAIHTIKGMAATMGYAGVAQLAHAAENLLDALRHSRVVATPAVFQLLFKAVDTLGAAVEAAAAGSEHDTDASLIADLDAASAGNAEAGTPMGEPTVSASAELVRAAEEPRLRRASDAPKSRPVQILISRSAVMRGARAALIVRRAETLGAVSGIQPPMTQIERDEFDGKLFFRLLTRRSDAEIALTLRAVGNVESVEFQETASDADAPGRGRQIRVELRRLDALMKQVGELVVAKNRLTAL